VIFPPCYIQLFFSDSGSKKAAFFDLGFEIHASFGAGSIFRHGYLDVSFRLDPEPSIALSLKRGAVYSWRRGVFQAFPFQITRKNF
jgi:hypothetical protein